LNRDDIVRSIVVQGTMLDSDTGYYESIAYGSGIREYTNPVEKAIAGIFRMCLDGSIDPWDIDLKSFTKIFLGLIDDEFRDFGTAGVIMWQAWKILREKSEESIMKRISQNITDDAVAEDLPDQWQPNEPADIEFSAPVRHQERRKVFLVELLDAMREAYAQGKRERKQAMSPESAEITHDIEEIVSNLHAEEPDAEIAKVGEIINSDGRSEIAMEEIWNIPDLSRQSFMVYCMFLMRERRIRLQQEDHYGTIIIHKPL